MQQPETKLVSIMIPTYNQEDFIEATIKSALNQSYQNLEIIVSDDCSTDQTRKITSNFIDSRVKYYRNDHNIGRVANYRKTLFERAQGEYVVNLDGDDLFIDNNFIEDAIDLIKKHNWEPLCLVAIKKINQGIPLYHKIDQDFLRITGVEYVRDLGEKYQFSHLTTIYNRKKALELNFYREDIISSDMESILRLALKGDVIVSQKLVALWNKTTINASQNAKIEEALDNHRWIDNVAQEIESMVPPNVLKKWKRKCEIIWIVPIILQHVIRGKYPLRSIMKLINLGFSRIALVGFYINFKLKIRSLKNQYS